MYIRSEYVQNTTPLFLSLLWVYMMYSAIFVRCFSAYTLADWILTDATFPQSTDQSICGYNANTDKIFLLGGSGSNNKNLMSYEVSCDRIHDHTPPLPYSVFCTTQCYTHFGNMLYFAQDYNLGSFDMDSYTMEYPLSAQSLNARGHESCLTVSKDGRYLFSLGGYTGSEFVKDFLIYDTVQHTLTAGPNFNAFIRCCLGLSCNVVDDYLYIFGGYTRYHGASTSIQFIDISDIASISSQSWSIASSKLNITRRTSKSVVFQNAIYNIGENSDVVDRFDIASGLSSVDTSFPMAVRYQCVIRVDDVLYLIYQNSIYMTYPKGSTLAPTAIRTCAPTQSPTKYPTLSPTVPTLFPTYAPSLQPTFNPTAPTLLPTFDPTFNPSKYPTLRQGESAEVVIKTSVSATEAEREDNESKSNSYILVACIAIIGSLVACIAVVGYCVYKKQQRTKLQQNQEIVQMGAQQSDHGNGTDNVEIITNTNDIQPGTYASEETQPDNDHDLTDSDDDNDDLYVEQEEEKETKGGVTAGATACEEEGV